MSGGLCITELLQINVVISEKDRLLGTNNITRKILHCNFVSKQKEKSWFSPRKTQDTDGLVGIVACAKNLEMSVAFVGQCCCVQYVRAPGVQERALWMSTIYHTGV